MWHTASVLRSLFPDGICAQVRFKIALYPPNECTGNGMSGSILSEPFGLELSGESDLSTLPVSSENQDRRRVENAILSTLQKHFFLDNPEQWTWLIASSAHQDDAYNALDLSRAGTADDKAPIKAPAEGKVVYNRLDSNKNPTLILEHSITINGKQWYWYTKILHMYHDENGQSGPLQEDGSVSPLALGSIVQQGSTTSNVGHFGNNGLGYETHLHEETFMAPDGRQLDEYGFFNIDAIDQRLLLTDPKNGLGLSTYATAVNQTVGVDGMANSVRWDKELDAWVSDSLKLIYNRHEQENGQPGNDSYWIAWHVDPNQRERVEWVHELPDGTYVDAWLNSTHTKKWNSLTQQWEDF